MTTLHTRFTPSLLALALAATLAMALAGCGKKDAPAAATQVAAKVGSEEISVHQINQVLSRTNTAGASPEAVQALSREVLEKLIDQQLAVEQAIDAKLHRSPDVVAQIEAARRDILARAYLQQATSTLPKPSTEDIKTYYTTHPELFAQRRVFNLQEIVLPTQPDSAEQLRASATPGRSMEDIAADLKAKGLKFNAGAASRAAEQIPLDMLGKIHALKDGQSTLLETPNTVTYLRLVSSQSAPVDEATASPRIEQFLANQRANDTLTANIKKLRATTTVTYMGDFANAATVAAAPAAPVPADPANPAKTALEKGLAGLK